MYRGKHGPTGVVVYEPTEVRPATDALVVQRELREALDRDEFVLHYQPKIDLGTGRVSGVEALRPVAAPDARAAAARRSSSRSRSGPSSSSR